MSRRSSTSSSETLLGGWRAFRPSRAGWLALGLLLALRLALAGLSEAALFHSESPDANIYLSSELRYRLRGPRDPSVLLLGTSRLLGVSSDCIARELGLAPDEVSNYSQLSPSFWRTVVMMRRNPDLARDARIVLIDVLPFQLFSEYIVEDELFLRLASLRDRVRVHDPWLRLRAVADWIFPAWSVRHDVAGWLATFRSWAEDAGRRLDRISERVDRRKDYIWTLAEQAAAEGNEADAVLSYIVPEGDLSRLNAAALDEILARLPPDAKLVLVWLPAIGDVERRFRLDPFAAGAREKFEAYVRALDDPRISIRWYEGLDDIGLERSDYFIDGVHLSDRGLERLCPILAGVVREDRPDLGGRP